MFTNHFLPKTTSIVVIETSYPEAAKITGYLNEAGYANVHSVYSLGDLLSLVSNQRISLSAGGSGRFCDIVIINASLHDSTPLAATKILLSNPELEGSGIIIAANAEQIGEVEQAIAAGAAGFIFRPYTPKELAMQVDLSARFVSLQEHYADAMYAAREEVIRIQGGSEIRRNMHRSVNSRLQEEVFHDSTTGIYNRKYFDKYLYDIIQKEIRERRCVGLLMIDIDYFKFYNDYYGHAQGDVCLKKVASAIHSKLKRAGDAVCRYGGEEFGVILPRATDGGVAHVAEDIRQAVKELNIEHSRSKLENKYVSISVGGISSMVTPSTTPRAMIEAADKNLYISKNNGRDRATINHLNELVSNLPA